MCPMSETQLAGLKKSNTPISEEDLKRVFTALGLRVVNRTDTTVHWTMPIDKQWTANAEATVAPSEQLRKVYHTVFYVTRNADKVRLGAVHRIEDLLVLQRKGATVMSEMFASVDDLTVFACPSCEAGVLTWDDVRGGRVAKAGMRCNACDWKGHNAKFQPYRELR